MAWSKSVVAGVSLRSAAGDSCSSSCSRTCKDDGRGVLGMRTLPCDAVRCGAVRCGAAQHCAVYHTIYTVLHTTAPPLRVAARGTRRGFAAHCSHPREPATSTSADNWSGRMELLPRGRI